MPRAVYPTLVTAAASLRPVCEMVLDLARKGAKGPIANAIKAVMLLRPDWESECAFMLGHEELIREALDTARIKRAFFARSKAHLLADALACTWVGHHASPSYSIQLVGEARRVKSRT